MCPNILSIYLKRQTHAQWFRSEAKTQSTEVGLENVLLTFTQCCLHFCPFINFLPVPVAKQTGSYYLSSFFLSFFSDGITTQDDGGESTEPEQPERTMYFGQAEETPG